MLFLGQGMICFGLHTCLVTTDLGGMTTASCSIDHCFRSRCNPLFQYETSMRDTTSVVSTETASLSSPMMTFFPLAFQLDPAELALMDCLTQVYPSEKYYDQLSYHGTPSALN
jgi:hypothetical protein